MSGDYDDLLAAFNISSADGQKQKMAAPDDKPPLTSPKKLALNEKASTTDVADVDSDDDDGWIIDETASGDTKKESTSPEKVQNGQAGRSPSAQNAAELENQNRRKQVFPKLTQSSPPGTIATSYTPMQGWKSSTTKSHPKNLPPAPQNNNSLSHYLSDAHNFSWKVPRNKKEVPRAALPAAPTPAAVNLAAGLVPPATCSVIRPIMGSTQTSRPKSSRSPGAATPIAEARVHASSPAMQSSRTGMRSPMTSLSVPIHVPPTGNSVPTLPTGGPIVQALGSPTRPMPPVTTGFTNSGTPSNGTFERMVIPVIDQASVVGKGTIVSPPKPTSGKPKAPLSSWALGQQSMKRLVGPSLKISKVYKPSVPWTEYKDYDAPEGGYPCRACTCKFLSESSLLAHLKRPSFVVTFRCDSCSTQKLHQFFNRCALWLHLMSHSKNHAREFEKLMKTVKIEPFTKKGFLSYDFGANCKRKLSDFLEPSSIGRVALKDVKCPGCMKGFKGTEALEVHLGRLDRLSMSECHTCRRLLRNPCEKQLHKLMHKKRCFCPGCGAEHLTGKDYYEHTVSATCLYWLMAPLILCSLCLQPHYSLDEFTKHLADRHHLAYYKCALCQLAFRGTNALYEHHRRDHKSVPFPTALTTILKCPLCKSVFTGMAPLQAHIREGHLADMVNKVHKYVYRCSRCPTTRNFFDKSGLVKHLNHVHPDMPVPLICDICNSMMPSITKLDIHRQVCYKSNKKQREEKRKDVKGVVPGQVSTETKRVLRCSLCSSASRVFYSTEVSFQAHSKVAHPLKEPYPIWVDLITTNTNLIPPSSGGNKKDKRPKSPKSPREKLAGPIPVSASKTTSVSATAVSLPPAPKQTAIATPTSKNEDSCDQSVKTTPSSKNKDSYDRPIKRPSSEEIEHKNKKAKMDLTEKEVRQEQEKVKTIPERLRTCSKCQFSSKVWAAFQDHIKTHKTNPSHHQCTECGTCFRSAMAVTRHSAMQHGIQATVAPVVMPLSTPTDDKPEKPTDKDEPSPPPPPRVATPPPPAPEVKVESPTMECTVCYRKFTTDAMLRNHMRTHGMAFIRSKRTSRDRP